MFNAKISFVQNRSYANIKTEYLKEYLDLLLLFIHYLQLGRHLVAGVVTCYISTDYEDFTLKFR